MFSQRKKREEKEKKNVFFSFRIQSCMQCSVDEGLVVLVRLTYTTIKANSTAHLLFRFPKTNISQVANIEESITQINSNTLYNHTTIFITVIILKPFCKGSLSSI